MSNPGPSTTITLNTTAVMATDNVVGKFIGNLGDQAIRCLGQLRGANANITTDQVILINNSAKYAISAIVYTNASASLTTASGGLYTGAAKTGTTIVTNAALSGLTAATVVTYPTVASTATLLTAQQIYFALTTAQGASATVDVYIYGYDLT